MADSNTNMKLFTDPKFNALLTEVRKLVHPIELQDELTVEVITFLKYVDLTMEEVRDKSTGREHKIKSVEATNMFGTVIPQILYKILNKFVAQMTSKYSIFSNTILFIFFKLRTS